MANSLIFFAQKMWVAFALQEKLLIFLQKNINNFENTLATTVNEFVINELIKLMMLWTTGPRWSRAIFLPFCRWKIGRRYFNQENATEISGIYEEQQSQILLAPNTTDNTIPR